MKNDLLSKESIDKGASSRVKSFCYTLGFISIFVNSIGLNLTQINTAYTEHIVRMIDKSNQPVNDELQKSVDKLKLDILELKKNSHQPK
jgi:uncharacterized protein (DUF2126 family)